MTSSYYLFIKAGAGPRIKTVARWL